MARPRRRGARSGTRTIGIEVAEAAIAGDDIRRTFFDRTILTIPKHITVAKRDDRAPRRIAEGAAGGNIERYRHRNNGRRRHQFDDDFHFTILDREARASNAAAAGLPLLNGAERASVPPNLRQNAVKLTRSGRFASTLAWDEFKSILNPLVPAKAGTQEIPLVSRFSPE